VIRLGLDLGSTTVKAVLLAEDGRLFAETAAAGADPAEAALSLRAAAFARAGLVDRGAAIVATGYGRALCAPEARTLTEITCHARGVTHLHPGTRTILDLGGQDAKAIRLDPEGGVADFAMNDRCAAGTGSFLDSAARRFGRDAASLSALPELDNLPEISATCAVFAESEVVGLVARGHAPDAVLLAVVRAVARRVAALARQIRPEPPVRFCGGVARNLAVRAALEKELDLPVLCADLPQLTGALGAALLA